MEEDPFAVVEAMTIAAYATGCEQGYVYIRGEYPLAAERVLRAAIARRARAGLLGERHAGRRAFAFDIELRRGAGAYICGEETALFNSIEGFRGEPRNKPPFPVAVGPLRQADRRQQRRDARQRARDRARGRRGVRRRSARGARPGPSSSASRGASRAPASTKCRSARRCGQLIELAGGVRRRAGRAAVLLGGAAGIVRRARASSTCR